MNPRRRCVCCLLFMTACVVAAGTESFGAARLLISGPFVAYGETYNEIHQFDLQTGVRTTLRSFDSHPGPIAIGPEGALYVAVDAEERIYKLNPVTGDTIETFGIPLAPLSYYAEIALKPNGNLLLVRETSGTGQVDEYGPDGTHQGLWLGSTYIPRGIKLTPDGKVALLCCGHPAYEPNQLIEYDLDGSNPRVVIESSMGLQMYSFQFASPTELLVMDRGPNPDYSESRIKRFDRTTTPATYLGDLITPPPPIPLGISRNAQDGSIYGAGPHVGGQGCVFGWASDGTPLNGGQPFPTCYGSGPLYAGAALVVDDCGPYADDHDGDGAPDCADGCPDDSEKIEPGICDCGTTDVDTDGDGTFDCIEECPLDANKTELGICGCGTLDIDSDGDQTADCIDGCADDATKTEPGVCGCGVADVDSDGDGSLDCDDECPLDANKTELGICGCGGTDDIGFAGFLEPIGGADATGGSFANPLRAFKLGSTIPVKFLASQCGDALYDGIHTLAAVKYSSAVDSDPAIDATPTDAATSGNQFRLADGEWHFNLSTKTGFSQGTWKLIATLSDGSQHSVWITIKK